MNTFIVITRRGFLKMVGMATAVVASGLHFATTVTAAAMDFVGKRQTSVYEADATIYKLRKSQDNPMIQKIYSKGGFLHDGPCGHKSHELLHTHYTDRSAGIKALRDKGVKLKI